MRELEAAIERVAREASRRGFAPSVLAMDAFEVTELPAARRAVLFVDTPTPGKGCCGRATRMYKNLLDVWSTRSCVLVLCSLVPW